MGMPCKRCHVEASMFNPLWISYCADCSRVIFAEWEQMRDRALSVSEQEADEAFASRQAEVMAEIDEFLEEADKEAT